MTIEPSPRLLAQARAAYNEFAGIVPNNPILRWDLRPIAWDDLAPRVHEKWVRVVTAANAAGQQFDGEDGNASQNKS